MHIFQFLNQRRRVRVIWPCVAVMTGCLVCAEVPAQSIPAAAPAGGATTSAFANQAPTYLRDMQPIFMGNCSRCHNQQSRFVYDWLDYKTAYADRWEIRRRIWDSWKGILLQGGHAGRQQP